jgi:manganese-transporting P-type ATPase
MSLYSHFETPKTDQQFPNDPTPMTSFIFQKKRFIYDEKTQQFKPVVFPIDSSPKLQLFQHSHGIASKSLLEHAEKDYGFNRFDIPIPGFQELFKEHAVAPFFVFQIFCVGLWCLDEFWYYSLFTLVMLVVFESTVVWQVFAP